MERFGKFCSYCNRQTLHEQDDRGGTICGTCGTFTGPSEELLRAQRQSVVSHDVIESIQASKRISAAQKEEEERKRIAGTIGFVAIIACVLLICAIIGGIAWLLLR